MIFHFPIISGNKFFEYLYDCLPGVPLFFALSGFLITRILISNKNKKNKKVLLKRFYIRRFLRIFPIYYLTIFFLLFAYSSYKPQFIYDLLYLSNFKIGFDGNYQNTIAPHFWTLAVEEQFYLFWPITVILFSKESLKLTSFLLFITGVFSLIGSYFISPYWLFFVDRTIGGFTYIGLGCFLACVCSDAKMLKQFNNNFYYLTAILSIIGVSGFYFLNTNILFTFFFSFLLIGFLILLSLKLNAYQLNKYWLLKPLVFIGKISYGIYVFHMFIPDLLNYFNLTFTDYKKVSLFNLGVLIVSVIVASLSWFTIERFFINLKNKFPY